MIRFTVPVWLLAAALLAPRPALAEDNCMTPGYLLRFNPILTTPQPCDPIHTAVIRWGGKTAQLRAVKLRDVAMTSNPAFERRLDEVAASVGRALDSMGGDLSLQDVTILVTNFVSPREGTPDVGFKGAYTAGAGRPAAADVDCPISYYKERVPSTGDKFVFVTAHEIFHCVQYATWRDMPEQGWLTEGTAEYFAYLAKSGYTDDPGFFTNFDALIPTRPLSDRDIQYEAVVFFLWLGQTAGPPRVREFTGTTRSIESAITPDLWIQFITAYLDRTIRFPDGRETPSQPIPRPTITVAGNDRFALPAASPYTVQSFDFAFERGKSFHFVHDNRPPDFRGRWRRLEGTAWEPAFGDVSTCDGPHTYRVGWGTTQSTNAGTLTITATNAAVDASLCSLLGSWVMTPSSLTAAVRVHEPRNSCQVQRGAIRLVFTGTPGGGPRRESYTGSYIFDNLTYRCELPSSAGGGWTQTTINGTATIMWQVIQKFMTIGFASPGTSFGTVHRETHTRERHYPNERGEDGVALPLTKDEPLIWGFMGPFLGGRYGLTGDQLHFDSPNGFPLDDYSFDFTRESRR